MNRLQEGRATRHRASYRDLITRHSEDNGNAFKRAGPHDIVRAIGIITRHSEDNGQQKDRATQHRASYGDLITRRSEDNGNASYQ
ncbi:hypothetical protein J6590_096332 [Homalodisca vitripennis]|nr:hypothetical protein J6590_096332 [Homalodisca vitripennis]